MSFEYCDIPLPAAEGLCGSGKGGTLVLVPRLLKRCPNQVMKAGEQSLVWDTGGLCQVRAFNSAATLKKSNDVVNGA